MLRSAAIGTAGNIGMNNVNDLSRFARAVEQGKDNYEEKSSIAQRKLSRLRNYSVISDGSAGADSDDEDGRGGVGITSLLGRVVTEGLRHIHQPDRRIRLNVSGLKFETKESLLFRYPQTLLGNSEKRAEFYCPDSDDFFFDRHRPSFEAIFRYYQTGKLIRPSSVPVDVFVDEMRFFRLGSDIISTYLESEGFIFPKPIRESDMPPEGHRRTIWRLMDFPESSIFAKIITLMCVIVIFVSIFVFCMETLPDYRDQEVLIGHDNSTNTTAIERATQSSFFQIETFCVAWFCIELGLRFYACPKKLVFIKDLLNIFDFVAIVPYFVTLPLIIANVSIPGNSIVFSLLRTMRLTRVFRIMKLSRHFKELQTLMKTVRASIGVLGMMVFFMLTMMVLYASCVFFADMDAPDTFFESIPDAFWWALVTMTTIGYGDAYPRTLAGKLIGSMCVITGLLVIALPVPIIVENFNNFYKRDKNMHIAEESVMEKSAIDESIRNFWNNVKKRCACSWVGRRLGRAGRRVQRFWSGENGDLHALDNYGENHVSSASRKRSKRRRQSLASSSLIELDHETVVSVISSDI
ncbi:shaker-related potassium channel tsha2-like isoform X1 [Branchiostoma floridae]|uniref:Shaker-related potassium channel tsha2-like isoform X1 n=2 Tax=Branchiostoma floridae TaxID=7739 RepID=A0A9J7LMT9_BRAFL|nr:shaker-related potassium channel tsha2-like isoform X1 [Branchiostoma floridae]